MKNLRRLLLVVLLVVPASVLGQSADKATKEQVTALLKEFMDAAGRDDRGVFDKFFADDVVFTRSTGAVITKADIMSSLGKAPATPPEKTTYSAEDITVHVYNGMAVVAFRLVGRTELKDGAAEKTNYRNTGIFLERDGKWQVLAWQATKIAEPAKPK